jgi:AcrR family transcriptional regulator
MAREERRAAILEATAEMVAERGYAEASIDEIVERAGVSAPVLYDHFPSKQALQLALLDEHSHAIVEAVTDSVRGGGSPEERLERGIEAVFSFVASHPFSWRVIFREAPGDPEVARLHRETQAETSRVIAELLAGDAGDTFREDPDRDQAFELVAELLKTGINGLIAWWYEHREVPQERLVAIAMDVVWVGLRGLRRGERWGGRQTDRSHPQKCE